MRAFSYAWSFPVTWQRWWSHHSINYIRKPHAACKLHGSVLKKRSYCRSKFYIYFFAPMTLTLTRSTFIYEYGPIPSRCSGWAKMNFVRQCFRIKLSSDRHTYTKRQTDRQTDRRTGSIEIIYRAASRVVKILDSITLIHHQNGKKKKNV